MDYTEVNFAIVPFSQEQAEIITALIAEIGFDSFTQNDEELNAYIPSKDFDKEALDQIMGNLLFDSKISYTVTEIKDQNWNQEWEKNFNPIAVENHCFVRAPFHAPRPEYKMEIIIEPKMAFGTGHHVTTWLMLNELFSLDLKNKTVLDMGCGTGILAIAAEKLGAKKVVAIDNDGWAYENTIENTSTNGCSKIEPVLGDATTLQTTFTTHFDIILANINLNILVADMSVYISRLSKGGLLIMSGILDTDIDTITSTAQQHGLTVLNHKKRNKWALVVTQKGE